MVAPPHPGCRKGLAEAAIPIHRPRSLPPPRCHSSGCHAACSSRWTPSGPSAKHAWHGCRIVKPGPTAHVAHKQCKGELFMSSPTSKALCKDIPGHPSSPTQAFVCGSAAHHRLGGDNGQRQPKHSDNDNPSDDSGPWPGGAPSPPCAFAVLTSHPPQIVSCCSMNACNATCASGQPGQSLHADFPLRLKPPRS